MSTSSLHHHFRQLTAMSPLQYQKWLRLNEGRRLMLNERLDAASAAFHVGYESPSQFSREYSRLFGAPPRRDIEACGSGQARSCPALLRRHVRRGAATHHVLTERAARGSPIAERLPGGRASSPAIAKRPRALTGAGRLVQARMTSPSSSWNVGLTCLDLSTRPGSGSQSDRGPRSAKTVTVRSALALQPLAFASGATDMRAGRPLWARPAEPYCPPQMSRRQAAATDNSTDAGSWPTARKPRAGSRAHREAQLSRGAGGEGASG